MSIQRHRQKAMFSFLMKGWDEPTALLACAALHPLDDSPVPTRAFEKAVRKRSREFARAVKRASAEDAVRLSMSALSDYRQLAANYGESYYITRFAETLAAGGGIGSEDQPEQQIGPDDEARVPPAALDREQSFEQPVDTEPGESQAESGTYTPEPGTLELIRHDAIDYDLNVDRDPQDGAAAVALSVLAQRLAIGDEAVTDPELSRSYLMAALLTGYWIGRALLGTSSVELKYSTEPDDAEDRGRRMTDRLVAANLSPIIATVGPEATGHLELHCGRLHRAAIQRRALDADAGYESLHDAALLGLVTAVIEHDTASS